MILEKIKSLSKEAKRDALYIAATVILIAIVAGFFIWSMKIAINAVDAAFFGAKKDVSSKVLSFDLIGFSKIAPKFNIQFSSGESAIIPEAQVKIPEESKIVPTASTSVAEIPASTPAAIINISKISLKILNGTTISGLAGSWKTKFINAGFKTENISTGNADRRDYKGLTVKHNSSDTTAKKITDVLNQSNLSIKLEKDNNLGENIFTIIIGK